MVPKNLGRSRQLCEAGPPINRKIVILEAACVWPPLHHV